MSCVERNDECLMTAKIPSHLEKKRSLNLNVNKEEYNEACWRETNVYTKKMAEWKRLKEHYVSHFLVSTGSKEPQQRTLTFTNAQHIRFSILAQTQLGSRDYQEDRFLVCNFEIHEKDNPHLYGRYTLLAVFDGHGGSFCSSWLTQMCVSILIKQFCEENCPLFIPLMLYKYFEKLNKEWDSVSSAFEDHSGSTHTMWLFQHSTRLQYIANLGDSRTISVDFVQQEVLFESEDHDFSEKQMQRIKQRSQTMQQKSNGKDSIDIVRVHDHFRVGDILALSRAHGDNDPRLVSASGHKVDKEPDVGIFSSVATADTSNSKKIDQMVMLASDGIWPSWEATDLFHKSSHLEKTAQSIERACQDVTDNKTFILCHLTYDDDDDDEN